MRSRKNQHISRLNSLNSVGIRVFGVWFFANRAQRFSQESDSVASDRTRLKKKKSSTRGVPYACLARLWFAFRSVRRPAARPTGTTGFVRASAVEAANGAVRRESDSRAMAGDGPAPRVVVFRRDDPAGGDPRGVEAGASGSRPPRAERGGRRRGGERLASDKASLDRKDDVREAAYERARERIFGGASSRDDSPSSFRSGRSASHSGASSRSASPSGAGGRSRPPVAIVRDRAADLKDPDFTRGATRFAPGVDDTQTYADVRRADGGRGARRGDGGKRGDDPRRSRAARPSGRSTGARRERTDERKNASSSSRRKEGPSPANAECFVCGVVGHYARDCPDDDRSNDLHRGDAHGHGSGFVKEREASRVPTASPVAPPVATRGAKKFADDDIRADDDDIHRLYNIDSSWLGDARAATLAPDARSRLGLDAFAALGFVSSSANERDDEIGEIGGADAREAREARRVAPSAGGVRPVGAARLLVPRALK